MNTILYDFVNQFSHNFQLLTLSLNENLTGFQTRWG